MSRATSAPEGSATEALMRPPQADRVVALGDQTLGYRLCRAARRTIGFVVGPQGLTVRAPRWVGQPQIDQAIQLKAAWILRKLAEQGRRLTRLDEARVVWQDGTALPWLGGTLQLRLAPAPGRIRLLEAPAGAPATLLLPLGDDAPPETIRDAVQRWMQAQARALFEARIALHAPAMGVQVSRLRLSSARTRWGSASVDGSVRLNWRLAHFPLETLDYVVVHELAHLREMNHGPAFWAIVRAAMPDYEQRRRRLRDGVVPVFD